MENYFWISRRCNNLLLMCLVCHAFSSTWADSLEKEIEDDEVLKTDVDRQCEKMLLNKAENCSKLISYYLYFSTTQSAYHIFEHNKTFKAAPFIPKVPIKIILHGFDGNHTTTPNAEIRPEYLLKGYNVISLDYFYHVRYPCYKVAAYNVQVLGICLSRFLKYMLRTKVDARKISGNDLHLIGYNLGSQIAGKAGLELKKSRLGRLTALDPMLPLFYGTENYVSREAAAFVDVIHTRTKMYKRLKQFGHVDFYINNPLYQSSSLDDPDSYSSLAPRYFADSISKDKYYFGYDTYLNGSKVVMGENTPPSARGIYGVYTNKEEPPHLFNSWPPTERKFIGVYKITNTKTTTMQSSLMETEPMEKLNNFTY